MLMTSFGLSDAVGGVDCEWFVVHVCVCISYVFHDCYMPAAFVIAFLSNIHCTCELAVHRSCVRLILTCCYYIPVCKCCAPSVISPCICVTAGSCVIYVNLQLYAMLMWLISGCQLTENINNVICIVKVQNKTLHGLIADSIAMNFICCSFL